MKQDEVEKKKNDTDWNKLWIQYEFSWHSLCSSKNNRPHIDAKAAFYNRKTINEW